MDIVSEFLGMPEWLLWIGGGIVVFELGEHIVFPLIWALIQRRRKKVEPLTDLIGRHVTVAAWSDGQGQVFWKNERWLAQGPKDLAKGEEVIVLGNVGLVLSVERIEK